MSSKNAADKIFRGRACGLPPPFSSCHLYVKTLIQPCYPHRGGDKRNDGGNNLFYAASDIGIKSSDTNVSKPFFSQ